MLPGPLTTTEIDARPLSEYLKVYHDARRSYKYLYYCKRCVRNFDAKERTDRCNRCNKTGIVELPKEPSFRKQEKFTDTAVNWLGIFAMKLNEFLRYLKEQARHMNVPVGTLVHSQGRDSTFLQAVYMHLLRIRILFHYLTV